ncbi:MAG: M23 family metallopeptidase [Candidatus Eisenbacteria sp.]|nr:M23 family metallopeptidase [Candidatus Eisenbacteria bacterium]
MRSRYRDTVLTAITALYYSVSPSDSLTGFEASTKVGLFAKKWGLMPEDKDDPHRTSNGLWGLIRHGVAMAGRYANLMLIPDGRGQTRQYRVRLWPIHSLIITGVLIFAFFVGAGTAYVQLHQSQKTTSTLQVENETLRGELVLLGGRIQKLGGVVRDHVQLANESRLLAGLAPNGYDVALMGVGGITFEDLPGPQLGLSPALERTVEVYRDQLRQLSRQLAFQEASFVEVKQLIEVNRERLDHIPTVNPVYGTHYISSGFGKRRDPFTGRPAHHNGIDFCAQRGTPIQSTADGVVTYVGRDGGYGKTIKIDHGNEFVTVYAHCNRILVGKGQHVHRGDEIGEVGNTGRSTGDHLHYEIRLKGRPLNPRKYMLDEAFGG